MSARDMYADLEKIEARGKRKKEKSKGLFSSFGKKDEPEESPDVTAQPQPPEEKPVPAVEMPAPEAPPQRPAPTPTEKPAAGSAWKPPTGSNLRKAEEELLNYKRWLNKGYKSGVLTKEQCVTMVRAKEIELDLRAQE